MVNTIFLMNNYSYDKYCKDSVFIIVLVDISITKNIKLYHIFIDDFFNFAKK